MVGSWLFSIVARRSSLVVGCWPLRRSPPVICGSCYAHWGALLISLTLIYLLCLLTGFKLACFGPKLIRSSNASVEDRDDRRSAFAARWSENGGRRWAVGDLRSADGERRSLFVRGGSLLVAGGRCSSLVACGSLSIPRSMLEGRMVFGI